MFKIYFNYLFIKGLKYFLIILFAITISAAFIDLLQNMGKIDGFNLRILYFFYIWEDFLTILYPLAFIFGVTTTLFILIDKNSFIALFSFGYSKDDLFKPFLILFFISYFAMLILNSTSFAYAKNRADAIVKKSQLFNDLKNIFFKYNDSYFYAKKLDPVKKEFYDIYLYKVSNKKVLEILKFKKAYFSDEKWIAKDGIKRELIYKGDIPSRYIDKKVASIEILKGYKPKVIKLLYEGKRVSLVDGFRVVSLIKSKDIDISKIKASLIQKIFIPFFALAAIIIIFYKIKFVKRELKKGLAILTIILGVLVGWALLFAITLLSENGVINGLYAIPAIILLMLLVAFIVKKSSFNTI